MRVVVLGAGAVGSLFGARFREAGHDVTLVGRQEHVRAIRTSGLTVLDDRPSVVRLDAATRVPSRGPLDAALVTVKTFDLAAATEGLARARPQPVPTLLTQNGLGVEETARASLAAGGWREPNPWVLRGVHSIPSTWVGPGTVRAAGAGELLLPEPGTTEVPADRVRAFVSLFESAGFRVRTVADLPREVWRKLLVNAAINPVTAVRGIPNGELRAGPARSEALALLREAVTTARSAGYPFSEPEAVRELDRVVEATAANRSSMLQDVERGRPTEIDAISGELLRVAAAHGLDLPSTRAVVEAVRRRAATPPPQRS